AAISDGNRHWIRFADLQSMSEEQLLNLTSSVDTSVEVGFFDARNRRMDVSSGERVFLRFSVHFLSYASKGALVLIDEPETHLHPNLVSSFAVLLYRVLKQTKSVAIVATHSPFFVREVPSHCVHILRKNEDCVVEVSAPYL